MHLLPLHVLLIGALIAWAGLTLTWSNHIKEVSEQRRLKAVARGEKWLGRCLFFGIPALAVLVYFFL